MSLKTALLTWWGFGRKRSPTPRRRACKIELAVDSITAFSYLLVRVMSWTGVLSGS